MQRVFSGLMTREKMFMYSSRQAFRLQGKWLAAFPKKQQKLYLAEYPDMAEKWDEKYGDREIKLVFIGQHMDRHAIIDALDECLSD